MQRHFKPLDKDQQVITSTARLEPVKRQAINHDIIHPGQKKAKDLRKVLGFILRQAETQRKKEGNAQSSLANKVIPLLQVPLKSPISQNFIEKPTAVKYQPKRFTEVLVPQSDLLSKHLAGKKTQKQGRHRRCGTTVGVAGQPLFPTPRVALHTRGPQCSPSTLDSEDQDANESISWSSIRCDSANNTVLLSSSFNSFSQ